MGQARMAVRTLPVVVLAIIVIAAWAATASDFTFRATYETSNETDSGDDVVLTFDTEIFNLTGGDILGATVRLEDPFDRENPHATWPAVAITNGASAILGAEVTVPAVELDAWRRGLKPELFVEYTDELGETVRAEVQTIFGPVSEEGGGS